MVEQNISCGYTEDQLIAYLKDIRADGQWYCWIDTRKLNFSELRYHGWFALHCTFVLEHQTGLAWQYILCYNENKILLYCGDLIMNAKFTVEIPYFQRSKYKAMIFDINRLIGAQGVCMLYVSNIPQSPVCILVIESKQNTEEIHSLICKNRLELHYDKGTEELTAEMGGRKWDAYSLIADDNIFNEYVFENAFSFQEDDTLKEQGYQLDLSITRPKLFISYCHEDKVRVREIVEQLKNYGLNPWIDYDEIDLGDNILDRVSGGIKESDFAMLFLSRHTKDALFAHHELNTLFSDAIYKRKKIIPVLLDQIDPNDLYPGLGGLLYFSFIETPDIERLAQQLQRALKDKKKA